MNRFRNFIINSFIGGILVLLPILVTIWIIVWIINKLVHIIRPIVGLLGTDSRLEIILAYLICIAGFLFICFMIGAAVRTRSGTRMHNFLERHVFNRFPGYKLITETINLLFSDRKFLFSRVVMAQIFENDTYVTGFITDEHPDGLVTVFVPTGPNPTSGMIYHVDKRFIHPIDAKAEETIKTILGCGAGSRKLIDKMVKKPE